MPQDVEDGRRAQIARVAAQQLMDAQTASLTGGLPLNRDELPSPTTPCSALESSITLPSLPTYSVNAVATENILTEGAEIRGRISAVRRFFCLYVTFDFLFTGLLWLICMVVIGGNYVTNLLNQMRNVNISTSLFDIVLTALCRTVLLLLFYALLRIQHWWLVALTTAASSAYLIAKVFYYNWQAFPNQMTFSVILVLCSFVISWGESWFLDFKVLPQENTARELIANNINERTALLRANNQRLESECLSGYDTAPFYSPLQSAPGSDDEDDVNSSIPRRMALSPQETEYKAKGKATLDEAWQILNSSNWNEEKKTQNGDVVFSKKLPKLGKIFKITAVIDIKPQILLEELFYKIEQIPKWNPTVIQSKILHTVDKYTDVTYQISAEGGNGLVSSRDFVNLRHWGMKGSCYVTAGISIHHPTMPERKEFVRGENGPGAWVMEPVEGQPRRCIFHWLLNTNLKGWIPHSLIDQTLSSVMVSYVHHLRSHAATLRLEENMA